MLHADVYRSCASVTEQVRTEAAPRAFPFKSLLTAAVGAAVAWVAIDNGGFSLTTWTGTAVVVWCGLALAIALGLLPLTRLGRPALLVAAALGTLSLFSLLSTAWAADAEAAYDVAAQAALYLGVFLVVALCARRAAVGAWLEGLELGIVAIALLALVSRLFPSLGLGQGSNSALAITTRLSYPLGYWNGLAILVVLAVPLLLRTALTARTEALRSGAVAVVPFIAGVVYLASSRGGALVAAVGALAFILTSGSSWEASAAALSALVGSAIAVASLRSRSALLNGPVSSHAASVEGRSALALMLVAGLVSALIWLALRRLRRRVKPSRRIAVAVIATVGALVAVAVVLSHPVARFHAFRQPPPTSGSALSATAHLLNGSGSGRWQLWSAALDEWRSAKLVGRGAGSFRAWWDQHGSIALPSRDAHSDFLQALAELGLIGFACLAIVWLVGPALGVILARRLADSERVAAAAAASVAVAFAVGAAIDWMWQLPAVALVGLVALALALGAGSPEQRLPLVGRIALAALCLLVVVFEFLPLAAEHALDQSKRAAGRTDSQAAASAALRARALEPWAVSPLVQLALVDESDNKLGGAQAWIDKARRKDGSDWQVRLIAARIETKRGDVAAARRDLAALKRLYPGLSLFSSGS
jgi:O-Antigen ligase